VIRGQHGHGPAYAGGRPPYSHAEAREECRRVHIAPVHPIPQAMKLPRLHIAGDEGRLPRACRTRDPDTTHPRPRHNSSSGHHQGGQTASLSPALPEGQDGLSSKGYPLAHCCPCLLYSICQFPDYTH
jgi:hypothetical protein